MKKILEDVFDRIRNREILEWSYLNEVLEPSLINLIECILQIDKRQRPSLAEIKQHPWFQDIQ